MSDTLDAIISSPSPIKERWISLEMAIRRVVTFEERFGKKHLLLASHAALPSMLAPELLNLIHINFLDEREIPWIAEIDFLLSPLCHPIGDGLFEVEPRVREVLLVELVNQFGLLRPLELADFLLAYLAKKFDRKQGSFITCTQRWIALAYTDPDQVIKEMTNFLQDSLSLEKDRIFNVPGQVLIVRTFEIIAELLVRTHLQQEYRYLAQDARVLAEILYGDESVVRKSIGGEEAGKRLTNEAITLLSPAMQKWLAKTSAESFKSPHEDDNALTKLGPRSQTPLPSLWEKILGWVGQNTDKYIYTSIPKERTNISSGNEPLRPSANYFRLWLSEMFLKESDSSGKHWFPAVHFEVQLQFGDQQAVTFSNLFRPPQDQLAGRIQLNYPLTELMPYNGGGVEIKAALLRLPGEDYLATTISMLQDFSSLITMPLEEILTVAEKIVTETRDLLRAIPGDVHLGLHQTFAPWSGRGQSIMIPGYIAVILATPSQLDANRLFVISDQLYYSPQDGAPLVHIQDYEYMLFRVEDRRERGDWRLKNIEESLQQAIMALRQGEVAKAAAYKTVALASAWKSPFLTALDRRRVVDAIEEGLARIENIGSGAGGEQAWDLNTIMATHAMSIEQVSTLAELSAEQVFAE